MRRRFFAGLGCILGLFLFVSPPSQAGGTKTVAGRLRAIHENVLTIESPGLFSARTVEVEMSGATQKSGQLAPGMYVKVRYHEEGGRKVALEISARPEYASKAAKKAAAQTRP
jgi:hypothetical protein